MTNLSFITGSYPKIFKYATTVSLHKSGFKTKLTNYAPKAISNDICKIWDKRVKYRALNFLNIINTDNNCVIFQRNH